MWANRCAISGKPVIHDRADRAEAASRRLLDRPMKADKYASIRGPLPIRFSKRVINVSCIAFRNHLRICRRVICISVSHVYVIHLHVFDLSRSDKIDISRRPTFPSRWSASVLRIDVCARSVKSFRDCIIFRFTSVYPPSHANFCEIRLIETNVITRVGLHVIFVFLFLSGLVMWSIILLFSALRRAPLFVRWRSKRKTAWQLKTIAQAVSR